MKIKKAIILVLAVFLLALVAGCQNSSDDSPPVQAPENTQPEVSPEYDGITDPQEVNLKYGAITDQVELEKLWQEYFYDSITTIGNTREFNSASEIDPLYVAKFCWFKYISEHGRENLELANKDSTELLFPLDIVLEYAERYFNLTSLDVTKIEGRDYNPEKRAFVFNYGTKRVRPSHTDRNSWDIYLDKVTRNSDGTVTAILVNYDSYQTRRVQLIKTYTLKPREDGSLYFASGRWDYVNNHLVSLTGDYQRFDKIKGFDGNIGELSMLGEGNNWLILAYTPYDTRENASLMLLNPETMEVEKKLDLGENFTLTDIRLAGEKIMVRLKDRIMIINKTLQPPEEIPLPPAIKDKIAREPKYDEDGFADVVFGGYDLSSDLQKIVYTDEKGVKLFNLADNSEKLLSPTVPVAGSDLLKNSYHWNPRFIDNDKKVIATMTGYESTRGYTLCNLEEGTAKTYDITSEGSSTGLIRYDTGLLEIKDTYHMEKGTNECNKILYLDFKTGNVKEIKLEDLGSGDGIRDHDSYYVGENYAAFITYERLDNDYANNTSYVSRLNLKTLQVEPKVISIKAAQTHILGVLADGRMVFWYSLNPSENGVCITKENKNL